MSIIKCNFRSCNIYTSLAFSLLLCNSCACINVCVQASICMTCFTYLEKKFSYFLQSCSYLYKDNEYTACMFSNCYVSFCIIELSFRIQYQPSAISFINPPHSPFLPVPACRQTWGQTGGSKGGESSSGFPLRNSAGMTGDSKVSFLPLPTQG